MSHTYINIHFYMYCTCLFVHANVHINRTLYIVVQYELGNPELTYPNTPISLTLVLFYLMYCACAWPSTLRTLWRFGAAKKMAKRKCTTLMKLCCQRNLKLSKDRRVDVPTAKLLWISVIYTLYTTCVLCKNVYIILNSCYNSVTWTFH